MADIITEEDIDDMQPSHIMRRLGRVHHWRLHEGHKTRIWVALWKVVNNTPERKEDFKHAFMAYVAAGPPRVLPFFANNTVLGHQLPTLSVVVLGGENNVITAVPLQADDPPGEMYLLDPVVRPPSLSDPESPHYKSVVNICRKLANVMYVLKVYGNRFIRCDKLFDIFQYGQLNFEEHNGPENRARSAFRHINSFTSQELWSSVEPYVGNIVVKKWSTEYNEDRLVLMEYHYMQIEFEG